MEIVPFPVLCTCRTSFDKLRQLEKTKTTGKKFVTLAGGCEPEVSTLPPVTVSQIFGSEKMSKLTYQYGPKSKQ